MSKAKMWSVKEIEEWVEDNFLSSDYYKSMTDGIVKFCKQNGILKEKVKRYLWAWKTGNDLKIDGQHSGVSPRHMTRDEFGYWVNYYGSVFKYDCWRCEETEIEEEK